MSYDLEAYSPSPQRVRKENLRAVLQRHGWEIAFVSCEAGSKQVVLAMEGPIENDAIVIGWQAEDEYVFRLTQAATEEDIKTMEAIAETTEAVVGCEISVTIPYQVDNQRLADMMASGDIHYADVLKSAQSYYSSRTAAGR